MSGERAAPGSANAPHLLVMRGLDPRIHHFKK
jgi:hypothetical protein